MMLDATELRALIFDVDGTMYRQGPVRRQMFARLLQAYVREPVRGVSTLRALRAYRRAQESLRLAETDYDDISEAQLRLACRRTKSDIETMRASVARWMHQSPLDLVANARHEGLFELLQAAMRRELKLGVLSDYPAREKLTAMSLERFFDVVVTAQDEDVQRFKPDPRGLEVALRRLGVKREEALYIGDRASVDAAVAVRAGVKCVIIGKRRERFDGATRWTQVADYWELARNLHLTS